MIEHLLDEALVNALRRGSMAMTYADVEHARITEMVGIGQPVRYTEAEQRLIATHEAGHAVTAWLAAPNRTLEVLTIIRRGDALGLLAHGDCEEVWTHSHYDLRALVQIAMGGWVAEELFFGQTSTGPAGDLASATRTAAQMVGAAGMTGSLISFAATPHDLVSAVLSDAQARAQLEAVLDDARSTVRRLLSRHRHLVEALRDALLERHELIGDEITDVLEAATLRPAAAARARGAEKSAAVAAGAAAQAAASRRSGCGWLSLRGVPEGHTVHRIARQLTQDLVGRRLAVSSPQGRFAAGAARLDGQVLVAADAVGKQLFCTFESGDVLRVHLGLYGAWDFFGSLTPLTPGGFAVGQHGGAAAAPGRADGRGRAGARGRATAFPPEPGRSGARAAGVSEATVADLRGPAACEVLDPAGAAAAIARLGPDPASTDDLAAAGEVMVDAADLPERGGRPAAHGPVGGRGHRQHLPRRAAVPRPARPAHPRPPRPARGRARAVGRLGGPAGRRHPRGRDRSRARTCRRAARGGADDPTLRHWVYHRTGLPCLVSGTPVVVEEMATRKLYWCPVCQV